MKVIITRKRYVVINPAIDSGNCNIVTGKSHVPGTAVTASTVTASTVTASTVTDHQTDTAASRFCFNILSSGKFQKKLLLVSCLKL